ncbi:hypothetical protein ACFVU0_19585 [Streptomyces sp. NPDC058122]|uniref:hypothetical protein n=1 Tax=Streptomyces sp. NPDC058122 TaxID=3346349 RepID=UPI0036E56050
MGLADRAAPEDRVQQADVTRRLLYHLNAPVAAHCRLRDVLPAPGDDENPFLIGFLMHGEHLLRLYVRRPDRPGVIGADIRLTGTPHTALIASVPSLLGEEQYQRPAADDPHCDLLVDLTGR